MTTEPSVAEWAERLAAPEVGARQEAAQALLALSEAGQNLREAVGALSRALDDSDDGVRTTAAVALARHTWASPAFKLGLQVLRHRLTGAPPHAREAAAEAAIAAARQRHDERAVAETLLPFLAGALEDRDTPVGAVPLIEALGHLTRYGVDLAPAAPALERLLADPSWRIANAGAGALLKLARAGSNLGAAVPSLEAGLARATAVAPATAESIVHAYSCASALGAHAAYQGDGALADRLIGASSEAVREGAVEGFGSTRATTMAPLIGALARALDDGNGGVVYQAMAPLRQAVAQGVDLGPAVPALERLLDVPGYPKSGWVLGVDMILASDLAAESPSRDAAELLAGHYVNRRDAGGLSALLAHGGHRVSEATLGALRQRAEAEPDAHARQWVQEQLDRA
jgi:hypothetical protein